jgi:ABC-type antimicrobial peptide transport system permease subunit
VDWIEPIEQKSPFSSTFRKKASAQPGKTKKKRRAGWKKPGPVYLHLNVSRLVGNVPERNERKWTVVGRPQSASLVEMEFSLSCPSKGLSYIQSKIVVGIVADVNDGALDVKPQPHVYLPNLQYNDMHGPMNIAVRTAGDPAALASAVTGQIHSLDPDLAIAKIRTMDQDVSESVAGPRFNTSLLAIFCVAALFLAAIGIYGVLAYTVVQQTHEIGVRIALGAQQRHVLRLVLAQGARLALIGIVIGLLAAFGLTRLMASLLYGLSASDPLTFAAVSAVLFVVALLACYIPARRAMRVDPMVALRYE